MADFLSDTVLGGLDSPTDITGTWDPAITNMFEGGFTPETFSAGLNPGDDLFGNMLGGLGNIGLADILKLGGLGLGGAGILGSLFGRGAGQQPTMGTPQRAALNQLQQGASAQAGMGSQMYGQGAGLLQGMLQGQIPPGLSAFVDQLYGPQLQNLGSQAIEQSRRAGFALPQDAFTGGPGGAVLGPGLAQMPGMKANTLMQMAQQLMGQGQAGLQGLQGAAGAFPYGQQTQPSMANRIQGTAPFLQGMGNILNPPQQQKAPFDLAALLGQQ